MKKGIYGLILTASCLFLAFGGVLQNFALAAELSPKTRQVIDNAGEKDDLLKSIESLNRLSPKELEEFTQYIEYHSQEVPPVYFILMADYIYNTNKDKAALWYYIGKLRSYQDVMMCADTTAQSQVKLYPAFAPKTLKYLSKKESNKKYIINLFQNTLDWDSKHPQRVEPVWACRLGISAKTTTPQIDPKKNRQDVINTTRNDLTETIQKLQKSL
jgi:hypothetical protein